MFRTIFIHIYIYTYIYVYVHETMSADLFPRPTSQEKIGLAQSFYRWLGQTPPLPLDLLLGGGGELLLGPKRVFCVSVIGQRGMAPSTKLKLPCA